MQNKHFLTEFRNDDKIKSTIWRSYFSFFKERIPIAIVERIASLFIPLFLRMQKKWNGGALIEINEKSSITK